MFCNIYSRANDSDESWANTSLRCLAVTPADALLVDRSHLIHQSCRRFGDPIGARCEIWIERSLGRSTRHGN